MSQAVLEIFSALGTLTQTPEGQGAITTLTVLGGLLGWIGKRWIFLPKPHVQELCYSFISKDLVSPGFFEIPGLEIVVNGEKQARVAITNLCFWNHGSKVIRGTDWAPMGPLTVTIPRGCKILSFQLTAVSQSACNFQVRRLVDAASEALLLTFDFCGKSDGSVLQIVHTGSPLNTDLIVAGTLVEGEEIRQLDPETLIFNSKKKMVSEAPMKTRLIISGLSFISISAISFGVIFIIKNTLFLSLVTALIFGASVALVDWFHEIFKTWRLNKLPRLSMILRDGFMGIRGRIA